MPGHSKSEVYLHLVWAVKGRQPLLDGEVERLAHRVIESEAREQGCAVLALGGTDDHVHLLVKLPGAIAVQDLAHQVKGASSRAAAAADPDRWFAWQVGYSAFSVSPRHVGVVRTYIEEQRARHAAGDTWATVETTQDADIRR